MRGDGGCDAVVLCTAAPAIKPLSLVKFMFKKTILRSKNPGRMQFKFAEGGTPQEVDWLGAKMQIDARRRRASRARPHLVDGRHPARQLPQLHRQAADGSGGDILLWKRKAERYLLESGMDYTIITRAGSSTSRRASASFSPALTTSSLGSPTARCRARTSRGWRARRCRPEGAGLDGSREQGGRRGEPTSTRRRCSPRSTARAASTTWRPPIRPRSRLCGDEKARKSRERTAPAASRNPELPSHARYTHRTTCARPRPSGLSRERSTRRCPVRVGWLKRAYACVWCVNATPRRDARHPAIRRGRRAPRCRGHTCPCAVVV